MPDIKVYKMFGSGSASANAVATYDTQEDGEICSILMDGYCTGADALNDGFSWEVSFSSVQAIATNDTRAALMGISSAQNFLTTGGAPVAKNSFITFAPFGIPVSAGERLYLHLLITGAPTLAIISVFVYHCLGRPQNVRQRVGRRVR